jgi:cathepsin D
VYLRGTLPWRICSLEATDYLNSDEFPADGVLGMGFQSISINEAPPVFQTLVGNKQTTKGVFAFKLSSSDSELSIGGLNPNLYSGTPTYTPVLHKAFWQIELSAIKVGGTPVAESKNAIVVSVCP